MTPLSLFPGLPSKSRELDYKVSRVLWLDVSQFKITFPKTIPFGAKGIGADELLA